MKYLAREIMNPLGYLRWENFHNLIKRADHLIRNGRAGSIIKRSKSVSIGSGAVREIVDYELDENGYQLVRELTSSMKLNGTFSIRNETTTLTLLKKYCDGRGITFMGQYRIGDSKFDCCVNDKLLIEFDEPHHASSRQQGIDNQKNKLAQENEMSIFRVGLDEDIIDLVLAVEAFLS